MDGSGNLYGTTYAGGASNYGTVFELVHGSGTITTLASFPNNTTSYYPYGGVIMDSSGNLYGTTCGATFPGGINYLGATYYGTVFEVAHGSGTITTLASFNSTNGGGSHAGLIMDSSGNLYGTTSAGGAWKDGTVFEVAHGSGTITTLASFNGADGSGPVAGLIMDSSGNLYGTTKSGGASGDGTVFEVGAGSGLITTMVSFGGSNGASPVAGVIKDSSGNLYGTTEIGGVSNYGTVFELPGAAAPTSLQISGVHSSTGAGASRTLTVAVPNTVGSSDTGYAGTVEFTSADSTANLPANNTVTALEAVTHPFSGFALKKKGQQSITDTLSSSITGSLSVEVS